jgi:hypothetical protein
MKSKRPATQVVGTKKVAGTDDIPPMTLLLNRYLMPVLYSFYGHR